jgi:outer membrane protein OmpA-like peptidoglycan-associated protein
MKSISIAILLSVVVSTGAGAQRPAEQGHPLIPPYPGSTAGPPAKTVEFDEFEIPIGPGTNKGFTKTEHVEGRMTSFYYGRPKDRSQLEIFRNYEEALKAAGFQTLFTCTGRECGIQNNHPPLGYIPSGDAARYLAARLARPEGDVYVAMHVQPLDTRFVIVETKPMATGLVKISADALAKDINSTGHVAVYDILFDTGSAVVKPESTSALAEIAKLLSAMPSLTLHVVGHTDNVGALAQNLDLSRRRASAVVTALTTTHKIAPARLRADGVGPLAPVASNDSDSGRAKNRRVELVKQ